MQHAPNRNQAPLFSPIFSGKTEKIGPPEARQKRPRRNEPPQATSLILCAHFFLSKPQAEFAVWVLWQICSNLSGASSQLPWKGSLFLQLFPLLPAENRPGGRRGGKTGRPVRTSARSTRTFCTPQNKKRETVHIAAGSAPVGGYFV